MRPFIALKNYVLGSYAEARKVSWPTRQLTLTYSALVIGLSTALAIFFAVLDYVFNIGLTELLNRF